RAPRVVDRRSGARDRRRGSRPALRAEAVRAEERGVLGSHRATGAGGRVRSARTHTVKGADRWRSAAVAVVLLLAAAACTEARGASRPTASPPGPVPGAASPSIPPPSPDPTWSPQPPSQILSGGAVLSGVGVPEPGGVLAIGDSILFSATEALTAAFGGDVEIDAQIGREFVSAE